MGKQVYVDIGYHDPTIVYEIKLVKVAEIPAGNSLQEIISNLKRNGIDNVLLDASSKNEIEMMREANLLTQKVILRTEKK